jgi:hypothetical protein
LGITNKYSDFQASDITAMAQKPGNWGTAGRQLAHHISHLKHPILLGPEF